MACVPFVPIVVAKQSFLSQTAPLPITTLYTPTADGDYRVNVYIVMSPPVPSLGGQAYARLTWTDEFQTYSAQGWATAMNSIQGQQSNVIHSVGGQPIQLNVTYGSNDPSQTYDVFVSVVEE